MRGVAEEDGGGLTFIRVDIPGSSRTIIYVSQEVASDSLFPFEAGEDLWVRIDPEGERLIVEAYEGQDEMAV